MKTTKQKKIAKMIAESNKAFRGRAPKVRHYDDAAFARELKTGKIT